MIKPSLAVSMLVAVQLLAVQIASAQSFPSKPLRIIMPNVVGGPHDTAARAAAQSLSQTFGQPVVVDNRPAGNGVIGTLACAKAPPDGYSLCLNSLTNISLNPFLIANLPYDPPKDFAPVIQMGTLNSAFVVNPAMAGVNNVKDLLDAARARPATITWSSFGPSSNGFLYQQWLKKARNAVFLDVPYKSAIQGLNAALAGEVQVSSYALGGVTPHIKAGKLRALAVSGERRSAFLPDVPTMKEQGIELDIGNWFGIFAPVDTPRPVVQRLNAEFAKLLADPEYSKKVLVSQGFDPEPVNTPEQFAAFLKANREMCENLVKTIGMKPE